MSSNKIFVNIGCFCFGLLVGAFGAVIVVREAVPLRNHVVMIGLTLVLSGPILLALLIWYFKVINSCRQVLGESGGGIINSIMSFLLVSIVLLFLIISGIFYAAIV